MKLSKQPWESHKDVHTQVKEISEDLFGEETIQAKHHAGRLMQSKSLGFTMPTKKTGIRPSREGRRLLRDGLFQNIIYPNKLLTTSQKIKYLNKAKEEGNITDDIYKDLIGVLQ